MYATCLFCHSSLGRNESIENFPIGRRLAFDAAKGRLWVVCVSCARWNLSPLEERWEAIDEAERAYHDTKKRVATENIGLARLRDRTELIRIGKPLRHEFAAWRYGDRFATRRRKALIVGGTLLAGGIGATAFGTHYMGGISGFALYYNYSVALGLALYNGSIGKKMLVTQGDRAIRVKLGDQSRIVFSFDTTDQTPLLQIPRRFGMDGNKWTTLFFNHNPVGRRRPEMMEFTGDAAMRTMSRIIPSLNGTGGKREDVKDAVARVEHENDAIAFMQQLTNRAVPFGRGAKVMNVRLAHMLKSERLALEMMLHEDDERRALEGELHMLEQRWKDAEEVAAIADSLTLPDGVTERMNDLRNAPEQ